MKVSEVFARQLLERFRRRRNQRSRMARAVDRLLKLFRRQKLRNRSLKLKLGQRACFVFVDFSLRERRIANNVRKQLERLVQVLNQAARC